MVQILLSDWQLLSLVASILVWELISVPSGFTGRSLHWRDKEDEDNATSSDR